MTFDPESHTYRLDGTELPSVTQILKALGLIDDRWFTEESRARGSAVHQAIQYLAEDDLDEASVAPEIAPYVDAYRKFVRESGFVAGQSEIRLVSEIGRYAGTADLFGKLNGLSCLIEIKTGAVQEWTKLQIAAYAFCFSGELPRRFTLGLRQNGTCRLRECKDPNDYKGWLACLTVYGLLRDYGRLNGGDENGNDTDY